MKLGQKGTAHVGKIKLRDFMDQVNHVFKRKTKKKYSNEKKQISPSKQPLLTPKSTVPENLSPPTTDRPMIKADTVRKL